MLSQIVDRCDRCGCALPGALSVTSEATLCYECKTNRRKQEMHHKYGRSNPETVKLLPNLHREMDSLRKCWPEILKQDTQDGLLQGARQLRFEADMCMAKAKQMYVHSDDLIRAWQLLNEYKPGG